MAEKDAYYIEGYDKDADVYDKIAFVPSYEHAIIAGKALLYYHDNVEELRRTDTQEPFDWFIMSDEHQKPLKIFTSEYSDGISPEALKKEENL